MISLTQKSPNVARAILASVFLCWVCAAFSQTNEPSDEEVRAKCAALAEGGRKQEAISLAERWLKRCESTYGEQAVTTVNPILMLAQLNRDNDLPQSKDLYVRALAILERHAPEHPYTKLTSHNVSLAYFALGDHIKAKRLIQKNLDSFIKFFGEDSIETANTYGLLGLICSEQGDFADAELYLLKDMAAGERIMGPKSSYVATSLDNLAGFYFWIGDYQRSIEMTERSLGIRTSNDGIDHPHTIECALNLGSDLTIMGNLANAEALFNRNLKLLESKSTQSAQATADTLSRCLDGLARLSALKGEYGKAVPLQQRALDVQKKHYGPKDPFTALCLTNLACLYSQIGDWKAAEPLTKSAMDVYQNKGEMSSSNGLTSIVTRSLCLHYLGNHAEALALASEAHRIKNTEWQKLIRICSESQLAAACATHPHFDLPCTIGNAAMAAEASLWSKCSGVEITIENRRACLAAGRDPILAKQFDDVESLKSQLRQASLPANGVATSPKQVSLMETQLETLQKQITRKVNGFSNARSSLRWTIDELMAAIPKYSVVVDFIRYTHRMEQGGKEDRYSAVLMSRELKPRIVSLGAAEPLDAMILKHRNLCGTVLKPGESSAPLEAPLEQACRDLYAAIAAPIVNALPPGTTELILCPDGQMQLMAFPSLIDRDGKFFVEKFTLLNVSATRDLLRRPNQHSKLQTQKAVLLGNPNYSSVLTQGLPVSGSVDSKRHKHVAFSLTKGRQSEELHDIFFETLDGTKAEIDNLGICFKRKGLDVITLSEDEASESNFFKTVDSPFILHLATHGFFFDELPLRQPPSYGVSSIQTDKEATKFNVTVRDPMLRGGLALSGAQSTVDQWQRGAVPPLRNDGMLTAEEASSLRLNGTFLVTLSACATGIGEATNGEGVLGLKRAFTVGGAENLLLTLWNIDDMDTACLMEAFYNQVLDGEHPARALSVIQKKHMLQLRKKGLFHAINRSAPFVLVAGTALPPSS